MGPDVVVACIVEHQAEVLLCRRATEPRMGFWTLPGGYIESGESSALAALRETREEAGVDIKLDGFYILTEEPSVSQIYLVYRAHTTDRDVHPGPEVVAAQWFAEDAVPWAMLTYPRIGEVLGQFFRDRAAGRFPIRFGDGRQRTAGPTVSATSVQGALRRTIRGQHFLHLNESVDGYL
jgi:ADP-ribose pyrophosphatase YjhB (NUDIX family)